MPKKPKHNELNNPKLRKNTFTTPEGYFDTLHNSIMEQVNTIDENSMEHSRHLKENIFTVPEGYFESLTNSIEQKTILKEPKVVPLFARTWVRYAVAAAVMFLAVFLALGPGDVNRISDLGELSDQEILEYLIDEDISSLDMIASIDGAELALSELIDEEMGGFNFDELENPELEYDFEYIEY